MYTGAQVEHHQVEKQKAITHTIYILLRAPTICMRTYEVNNSLFPFRHLCMKIFFLLNNPESKERMIFLSRVNISTRWLHDKYWKYSTACCLLLYFIQSKFFREHVFDCVLKMLTSKGNCNVIMVIFNNIPCACPDIVFDRPCRTTRVIRHTQDKKNWGKRRSDSSSSIELRVWRVKLNNTDNIRGQQTNMFEREKVAIEIFL